MYESAIARLEIAKSNCERNVPILEAEQKTDEAWANRCYAHAYEKAIELLTPR